MTNYTLLRSRRRTLAIEVQRDGTVLVRAPMHTPQKTIDEFLARRSEWIAQAQQRQRQRCEAYPPLSPAEIAQLRQKAKEILPDKVAYWAKIMGVAPTGLKITAAQKRFGSCSGKNSLCFSLYLMRYPEAAIDAVVVHELAHIRHKNHSPAFYAEVARYLPDYRQRAQLLKNS